MIRKQLFIEEDLERELKRLSERTGLSEAEHVRTALRAYLERTPAMSGENPLLELAGLVEDLNGPDDEAVEHDHYLYGAPKRSK